MGGRLTTSELYEIAQAAERSGIYEADGRDVILRSLPPAVRAQMPRFAVPRDQLLSDLRFLDALPLDRLFPPLLDWLFAAACHAPHPDEQNVFLRYLARLVETGRSQAERSAAPPVIEPSLLGAGHVFDDRFVLIERLSESLFSVVWKAHDTKVGQDVALKIHKHRLDQRSLDRLLRGARHLSRMSHPHIVRVYDFRCPDERWRGPFYCWMEYLAGGDLQAALVHRRIDRATALRALRQAAEGLAASHEAGVLHRDVKPDNILLGADGRARIADFDLLRSPESDDSSHGQGTGAFAAPEARIGLAFADERSDVFGLARTAQFILYVTASPDPDPTTLLQSWARAALGSLDGQLRCSTELERLLRRATSLDPEQRPATVHDFIRELTEALDERAPRLGRRFLLGPPLREGRHGTVHAGHDAQRADLDGQPVPVLVVLFSDVGAARIDAAFPGGDWCELDLALCHPHIIPVRGRGRDARGRYWQATDTRPEARPIDAVRAELAPLDPLEALARVGELVLAIVQALAHAHAHGIVHRDLTPDHITVDPTGALIGGWTLAARRNEGVPATSAALDVDAVARLVDHLLAAIPSVADLDAPPPRAAGRDTAETARAELARITADDTRRLIPMDEIERRLTAWRRALDGRRALVAAAPLRALARRKRAEARRIREEVARALDRIGRWEPEHVKAPLWDRHDAARELDEAARLIEAQWLAIVYRILPDVPEARIALVDFKLEGLAEADADADGALATRIEAELRAHADLPRVAAVLDGCTTFVLRWHDPELELTLAPLVERRRRLVAGAATAITGDRHAVVELPRGDYLLIGRTPAGRDACWPLHIGRGSRSAPIELDLADHVLADLEADARYVPGGPAIIGGGVYAVDPLPRRVIDIPAFIARRHPVTQAQYLAFLNHCHAHGRAGDAARFVPRGQRVTPGGLPPPLYVFDPATGYRLPPDGSIDPDCPVWGITWFAAHAYAAFIAWQTGRPWRLMTDLEWEKAARGVDGRLCPWGQYIDEAFANVVNSLAGLAAPIPITRYPELFPADISPYGIIGLAGNMRTWCSTLWRPGGCLVIEDGGRYRPVPENFMPRDDDLMVIRGGAWSTPSAHMQSANRYADPAGRWPTTAGIRLARSITDDTP